MAYISATGKCISGTLLFRVNNIRICEGVVSQPGSFARSDLLFSIDHLNSCINLMSSVVLFVLLNTAED